MQKVTSVYINLFIVILLMVAAFVIFYAYSKVQESKSAQNWEKTFGRIQDLPNQYPNRNDNEAAIHLKRLANRLGINFAVDGEGQNYLPQGSDAERFIRLNRDFPWWKYFGEQFDSKDDLVDPPYGLLAKYLADYRLQLEDVRDYILISPPILWRQNLWTNEYGHPGPALPNMYGISDLQRIMAARVLELAADRDYQEAQKYLEAGWKLNESLKSRCDLSSQQHALGMDIRLMNLMRKLPLENDWIPKIVKHDYEKAYIKGFTVEAWFLWRERNEHKMAKSSILNNVLDPYLRLGVSSLLEEERKLIEQIQAMSPCDLGYKEFRQTGNSGWARIPISWELYDKIGTYGEITELKLLRELTTKVIKVKHGYFPKDGNERSEVCKDGTWEYWRSPDASTTIKYKGRIELPRTPPAKFPTPFTVTAK